MRITIEKGFQPLIRKVMEEIQVEDPKLALNHILGIYAASQSGHPLAPLPQATQPTDIDDEFAQLTDWS
ncbi:hypothetical protein IQ260_00560 [Leptolyngbya cf. ectocarpi LEGE 11479]|uniref:Uncharacterized protein n=1 Tax=Leptolyngbya cf. ectocarpi LEGE 11479 TaxID=1828722 RepID=A0A928ZTD6_LEPEC|nr:hypothetical protein [Leptolyngbya ectocarpi]MBE9065144.1 hypothetical protein [Leptolyngbya cf. ectocarpi LEGE 11479]